MEDGVELGHKNELSTAATPYHQQHPHQEPRYSDTEPASTESNSSPVELYAVVSLLSIFVVVGAAGNAIVLWVFCRRRDQLVSTVFIVVLAGVDFITCLVVVPFTIVFEMLDFHVGSNIACKLYQFMITCNIPFSAMIMVAIAVDRYLCICRPFVHALTVRRAWITSGVLGICASAIGMCVAFMYSVDGKIVTAGEVVPQILPDDVNYPSSTASQLNSTGSWIQTDSQVARAIPCEDISGHPSIEDVLVGAVSTPIDELNIRIHCERQESQASVVIDSGFCRPSDQMFSADFIWYFQKFYNGMFLACVVIVVVLYARIYCSVVERRSRRQRQKSHSLAATTSTIRAIDGQQLQAFRACGIGPVSACCDERPAENEVEERREALRMTVTGSQEHHRTSFELRLEPPMSSEKRSSTDVDNVKRHLRDARRSMAQALPTSLRDMNRIRVASLKTAAMLFVVTVVFVATFLPAFLMTVHVLPYRMFVFYMYFANNVANPFIYSFMNQNFRENLQRLFCPN